MELKKLLADIRKADLDYDLISEGDRIAVGVSGGKDSMVLLSALHRYSQFPDKSFHVIGIYIRLGFPDMDFHEVTAFCEQEGIEFHQIDSKVYEILKRNLDKNGRIRCSLCSKFKKACVNQAAKALHCDKVAFGHHSDDAVETLLMNAIHGGKLATFLPKMYLSNDDITFIRPLVYAYEHDILSAQQRNHIPYVSSTCPNDGYTERQAVKELLQDFYQRYPMARSNFVRMLYNEEQMALWHREHDHNQIKKETKRPIVLMEEGFYQLVQRGKKTFIEYPANHSAKQHHRLLVEDEEKQRLLAKEMTMQAYCHALAANKKN